ncbi:hypothetical protein MLD52_13195 [Puniceicoccaceae bacterium K14]|nr:hypothetical protein [Puniceicoccaceae bacterium K14]
MIASNKVTDRAEKRWNLIVERFRTACIYHKKNRVNDSKRIIKEELPSLIKAWIQILPTALREDAKADLRDMFEREQAIVDQSVRLQKMLKETLVKQIIPQVEAKVAAKYRSLYISSFNQKRSERDSDANASSWVNPNYGNSKLTGERIGITNISDMIDSVQIRESEDIADNLVDIEDIAESIDRYGIDEALI